MKPLAILLSLAAVAGAEDILPQPLPKDRYAETIGKSPFVLETKAVETEAPAINPFQNLYLRGVGKADGKDSILIQRLGEERPMRFIGNEPGPDDMVVKSVRFGNSFRDTKVVVQKGALTGEIGFKEDTINAPPATAPAPGQNRSPAPPGQFSRPGGPMPQQIQSVRVAQPPPPMPTQQVPRPGSAVPMPQPVNTPQTPGTFKNRPRPINN